MQEKVRVSRVSEEVRSQKARALTNRVIVVQDEWREVPEGVPVENVRAHPCLITYIKDLSTGTMISGHFSTVTRQLASLQIDVDLKRACRIVERQYGHIDPNILIAAQNTFKDPLAEYISYIQMISRICELVLKNGGPSYEVHLFAQNDFDYQSIGEHANAQLIVTDHFLGAGIPGFQIYSHRKLGRDRIENTLYVPDESKIYLSFE